MARHRNTFALIIICLPILATVITAFRLRDLPKSHDVKKQKCESCEVNTAYKVNSANVESDKYDQQKTLRDVESDSDDDEDDDEDETDFLFHFGFRKEIPNKDNVISKHEGEISSSHEKPKKQNMPSNEDEEDSDDDNEDHDDVVQEHIKLPPIKSPIKLDMKSTTSSKSAKIPLKQETIKTTRKLDSLIENSDDDADDDEEKNDIISLKNPLKTESSKKLEPIRKTVQINKRIVLDKSHESDNKDDEDENSKIIIPPKIGLKPKVSDTRNTKNTKESKIEIKNKEYIENDKNEEIKKAEKLKIADSKKQTKTKPKAETKPLVDTKTKDPMKSIEDILKFLTEEDNSGDEDDKKHQQSKTHIFPLHQNSKEKKEKPEKKPIKKEDENDLIITKDADIVLKVSDSKKLEFDKKLIKPIEFDEKSTVKKSEDKKADKISNKDKSTATTSTSKLEKEDNISKKESDNILKAPERGHPKPKHPQDKEKKLDDKKLDKKATVPKVKDEKLNEDPVIVQIQKETKAEFEKKRLSKEHGQKDKSSKEKLSDSQEAYSKNESHLKHVTDALQRKNLLKSEFEDFYAFLPTFAPNYSRIHNPECRRHGQILLRQLRGTKLWALNMLDATAKIPSGVLQGNGIQLGDFDQCLASRARVQLDTGSVVKVQGKYCLARVDVKAEHPELEAPVHLAQAKNLIRSRIDDPGHFVPRFSTLSWGVCVPSPCNPEDVEMVLKDAVKHYQHTSGVAVRVKVDEHDCQMEKGGNWWEEWLELPTLLTLSLYGTILLLVFAATVQDFVARKEPNEEKSDENDQADSNQEGKDHFSHSFLSAFSLFRTIPKLIAPGTTDEIACIHGIRGISTIALLIAHKFLPVAAIPYTNRLKITEMATSPMWSWCRAGWIFTDCFLLLSGTLTAHRIATDQNTGALKRLFSRYLRLTPALLAVVLFYAYVWDNITTGPMWGTWVTKNAQICKEGWWWNLLYVQNYFGFEEMCAPQTHQLALDMQLTILGGVLVWVIQTKQGFFRLLLPGVHIFAAYSRYTTVRDHRLTMLAYHGVSVSQLYRTARLSYSSTLHRSTSYLIGLSLGLALVKPRKHGKFLLSLGWILCTCFWSLVWWAGWDAGSLQYRYSATYAAQYAGLAPLASAIAVAWVIYAVHNGDDGFLSRFLSSRPLVFISRLSYSIYLVQFIIFITNVATVKTSTEFTLLSLVDVKELSSIILASVILTLTFVTPIQSLHKLLSVTSKESKDINESQGKEEPKISEPIIEQTKPKREDKVEPQIRRPSLLAHREVLEEIPEVEVEYEIQREKEELEEILEEEEGDYENYSHNLDDDLEIIEEECGEEEVWDEREYDRRPESREEDRDLDEWEWTANGNGGSGAQYYRYTR